MFTRILSVTNTALDQETSEDHLNRLIRSLEIRLDDSSLTLDAYKKLTSSLKNKIEQLEKERSDSSNQILDSSLQEYWLPPKDFTKKGSERSNASEESDSDDEGLDELMKSCPI